MLSMPYVRAEDTVTTSTTASEIGVYKSDENKKTEHQTLQDELDTDQTQNTRMKSVVGSKSKWSGHISLTYTGPSVATPFGSEAPNPLNQVPTPEVVLAGTMAVHYVVDKSTSLSFGTGIQVYTPFSNPHGWSLADPYFNYNKLFDIGPIKNYAQVGPNLWTDHQYYTEDGAFLGFNFNDQSYYVFKNGITTGVSFWAGANLYSTSPQYDPSQQDAWYIGLGPYVEYAFNDRFSLRSVLGVQGDHTNATEGRAIVWENTYQTLGVGVQIIKEWYMYVYLTASPYTANFNSQNTGIGFNAIINLF